MIPGISSVPNSPFVRLAWLRSYLWPFKANSPKILYFFFALSFFGSGCRSTQYTYSFETKNTPVKANPATAQQAATLRPNTSLLPSEIPEKQHGPSGKRPLNATLISDINNKKVLATNYKVAAKPQFWTLAHSLQQQLPSPVRHNTSTFQKSRNTPADGALPDLTDLLVVLAFVIGLVLLLYLLVKLIILIGNLVILGGPPVLGGILLAIFLAAAFFYYRGKAKTRSAIKE